MLVVLFMALVRGSFALAPNAIANWNALDRPAGTAGGIATGQP